MAAPQLRIPLSLNMEGFKKGMQEASSLTRNVTKELLNQFAEMNKGLAISGAASGASWALGWVGRIALVVGAFKLMGDAISATRDQLKEMVDVADKSQNLGVSPAFFQQFSAESRKLKVEAGDLESALANAFNATKDQSPIDLSKWETGEDRITSVEKALRIYNATLAKSAGQQLEGLVLFREADSQEAKVNAVLKAMVQLKDIGQQAAALDIGEKMFGAAFVDRIRQGRTSAESILATMHELAESSDGIFSSAMVTRAKEVDDQLRISEDRLSRALKPSFDDLASTMLTIKNIWADTVGLIAQAVELANKFGVLGNEVSRLKTQRAELDDSIKNGNEISVLGFKTGVRLPSDVITADQNKAKRDEVQARIDDLERQPNAFPKQVKASGTGDAPTKKATGSDADKFDSSIDSIDKRIAALNAEAVAIDRGTAAREQSKIAAQLETVAKQANAAAGLGENVITEKQRQTIDEVSAAYGRAAEALAKARVASGIKFGQQTSLLDPSDVAIAQQLKGLYPDVATALASVEAQGLRTNEALRGISSTMSSTFTTGLTDILDGTKSVSQGFGDMSKAIIRALEEAVIKMAIVAPAMRALQELAGGFLGGGGNALPSVALPGGGYSAPIGPTQFDGGGYTGSGGKYQPAGVVHKGEVVWSQDDISRHGGVGVVEALRKGRGYANGGLVGMPSIPSVAAGGYGSSGNTQVNVSVKNYSNEQASVQQKPNSNGGVDYEVVIGAAVARQASMPGSTFSRAMDQRGRVASR